MKLSAVDTVSIFATLPEDARRELASMLRPASLAPGQMLFQEGDPGESFCIIVEGEVEIIKALGTEDERLLRVQGPGTFLGEMSLFEREGLRTASVRARTPVTLLSMTLGDFDQLMHRRPALAYEVVSVLSQRLRESDNATIRDLREKNAELARAYEELKAAQAQLIEKERLEQELRLAGRLQQSMLPQELPQLPGYDFGALMIPARVVGGDFFDFIPLDQHHLGILVADVSDKGMSAAIFMALARSLIRAEASRGVFPSEVLRRVNQHLLDINEAGMFLTVLYGVLNSRTGQLLYARAGHELPLLFSGDGENLPVEQGTGQLLGLLPEPQLDEQAIVIPPGGYLLLYTDGVTDAINETRELFGLDRLVNFMSSRLRRPNDRSDTAQTTSPAPGTETTQGLGAQLLCGSIHRAVQAFQDSASQFDDFTLLIATARDWSRADRNDPRDRY